MPDRRLSQALVTQYVPASDVPSFAGHILRLTSIECTLLFTLMREGGKVLTHQSLLHAVWGAGYHEEVDYIRVYLHTLRLKLEDDPRHPIYLETITGVGYRFRQPCTPVMSGAMGSSDWMLKG